MRDNISLFAKEGAVRGRHSQVLPHAYAPACEGAVIWNDPDLAIDWGTTGAVLSDKDARARPFAELVSPFRYGPISEAAQ